MTSNLRLGDSKLTDRTLTPEASDIASNFTMPHSSTGSTTSDYDAAYMYMHSSFGGFYTWGTATANSGRGMSSGNAQYSICPKNWHLPSYSDFTSMANRYGSNDTQINSALTSSPGPNMIRTGYIYLGSNGGSHCCNSSGTDGYFQAWLSTAYSSSNAYDVEIDGPTQWWDWDVKLYGFNVRCVKR